jgi:hypothetical protein
MVYLRRAWIDWQVAKYYGLPWTKTVFRKYCRWCADVGCDNCKKPA